MSTNAPEAELYAPVKRHLEELGFTVRAEVRQCDVVGVRDSLVVAVEMKVGFGLPVIYQALERLGAVDMVYIAVSAPEGRKARANWDAQVPNAGRLCRMLGVGLIEVRGGVVAVHAEPGPYHPRKVPKNRVRLLREFHGRTGDHNVGGTTKRPRVTLYRENALRIAHLLSTRGAMSPAKVRHETGIEKAAAMLGGSRKGNVYGWFRKVSRGVYAVSAAGERALRDYADVVRLHQGHEAGSAPPTEAALDLAA